MRKRAIRQSAGPHSASRAPSGPNPRERLQGCRGAGVNCPRVPIPEEIIERVREAHDIVEVVGRTVPLKKAGSAWKACCPLHDEDTPSFHVNPQRQIFKCFGCGKGGNVFHWLMESQQLTFPEAVRALAEERGIEVPRTRGPRGPAPDELQRLRLALRAAKRWFQKQLRTEAGGEALRYLHQRGYDDDAIETFGLGYAPPSWEGLLDTARSGGVSARVLTDAGLAKPRDRGGGHYDVFRHRVMFPIHDWQGRLVTFAGRALDPEDPAKYINGPETALFKKSRVLFGLDRAKQSIHRRGEVLLLEGYTDVLQCHLHGFDHAVAGMGTAFTDTQARLLRRFAERIVLLYDGDAAGQTAAERTLETTLAEGLDVRVATLPEGADVDEILLEEGADAVQAILDGALSVLDFKLNAFAAAQDLSTPRGRAQAAEALLPTLLKVRSPVEREQWIKEAAERLGGDLHGSEVERILRGEASRLVGQAAAKARKARPRGPARGPNLSGLGALDRARYEATFLAGALANEGIRDAVFRAVGPEEFATPVFRRLYNALFDLYERGGRCDREALAACVAEDGEALAALAELPDGPTLDERVRSQIAFLERQRASREIRDTVLAQLRAAQEGTSARSAASPSVPVDASPDRPPTRSTPDSSFPESDNQDNDSEPAASSVGAFPHGPDAAPESDEIDDPPADSEPSAWDPPVLDGPEDGERIFEDGWVEGEEP